VLTRSPRVGRGLLRRFLEAQAAMLLGALVCLVLGGVIRASPTYAPLYHPGTVLYFVGDLFFLTVPVVTWTIVRGDGWRNGLALAAARLVPVFAIVVLGELVRIDHLLLLVTAMYPAMSLGQLAHLFRSRPALQIA
jgi:hypothetical protein